MEAFCLRKHFCSWKKFKSEESRQWKKKRKKKKRLKEERKSTNLSRKEKALPLWKRLVLAELHAGVQILNKEVAIKPKFTIHNVKNQVSFSSYQPWYKKINTSLESQFWKLFVDSLFCSWAQFAVFPFFPRVFSLPLGTLLIIVSSSLTLHLVIEIKIKKNVSAMGFYSREILIHSQWR